MLNKNAGFQRGDEVLGKVSLVGRTHLTVTIRDVGERTTTGRMPIDAFQAAQPKLTVKAIRKQIAVGDQIVAHVTGKNRGNLVLSFNV